MAKAAVAGQVKTRLARDLGVAVATRFARHRIAALLASVSKPGAWETSLAITPDASLGWRLWPRGVPRVGQGRGDLGQRMQRIMRDAKPGPVVIVGTDVPGIGSGHIARAFRLLGRHDAVFGPASDGGYWLVGLRRRPRLLQAFRNVRWSTEHALSDTLANLECCSIGQLKVLSDVDDAHDFVSGSWSLGRRVTPRR